MKSVYGVVLLASFIALAHAFPGANRESMESSESDDKNDGVVLVLPARRNIFDELGGIDDDDDEPSLPGMWHPFRFDSNPFDSTITRMREALNKIRSEMAAALAGHFGQGGLTPWGKIPDGANTTSTTKIIGDHSVTINETTYTDGDENGGTIFRVRVVDVKPLNETNDTVGITGNENNDESGEETTKRSQQSPSESGVEEGAENEDREELTTTTQSSRSVETVEDFDNEIPKSQVDTLTA